MKKLTWVSMITVMTGLLSGLTPATPMALAATNEVRNTGEYSIGALQFFDGTYKHGTYDDLIPPARFSGYPHTAGFYVGPGYCVRVRGWRSGTQEFPPPPANLDDPIIVHGGTRGFHYNFQNSPPVRVGYDVRALQSTHPDCGEA